MARQSPEHIHIEQPGHLEGNAVFTYLDAFCTDEDFQKFLPEYANLDALKEHYTRGGLGDGTCKKFLYNVLNDREICNFSSDLAVRCNATVVVGGFVEGEELDENSLIFVSPDGSIEEKVYSKRHLVPFGEYVPLRKLITTLIPPLAEISMLSEDLAPGTDSNVVDTAAGKLGGLICFDSIYETIALDSVRDGAEIIVLGTNDSWFLDSAAVYMHNAQAKLRAVETGRYIVRSANTGISSIIDPSSESL